MLERHARLVLLLAAVCTSTVLADVVVLQSGTLHEGQVQSFDDDELVLVVESGKTILDKTKLASVHFGITAQEYRQRQRAKPTARTTRAGAEAPIEMGTPVVRPGYTLTVVEATIERPYVRDMLDELQRGKTPDLIIKFAIVNTDERKILRYREGNMFLASNFSLRDDVDNAIRGVNYGLGTTPVGALSGKEDIQPGAEASHLELFKVPPPKTKHLILTVNLEAFGDKGNVEFRVPAASIENFDRE